MSVRVDPADDIGNAWLATLSAVEELGGTATHVLTTVTEPGNENPAVRDAVDAALVPGPRRRRVQTVETVAATVFPRDLYRDQPQPWSPDLPAETVYALDEAAADLYRDYADMAAILATDPGNRWGTYFGRMTSWPNSDGQETNQLAERVTYLRSVRRRRQTRANGADVAVGGEGEIPSEVATGVQVHASIDRLHYGGPCLVHVDLSVHRGRLHMLAVYRHWHLITRGYGNLLGLSRLLAFLSEQSGYPMSELAVVAGTASTERDHWGGQAGVRAIIAAAGQDGRQP